MQLGRLLKDNNIEFYKYFKGNMYFNIYNFDDDTYYTFPIPVTEVPEYMNIYGVDRAILAVRWIRLAINNGTFTKKHIFD